MSADLDRLVAHFKANNASVWLVEADTIRRIAADYATAERVAANARKMVLLIEEFIYEPQRVTEAGLVAQIQRFMTNQDVEYDADREKALPKKKAKK